MTTTLRDILRQYADNGDLDAEYMPIAEYQTMANQADHNSDKVQELKDYVITLKQDNEALLTLLRQWADLLPGLVINSAWLPNEVQLKALEDTVTATKAALEE